jgi:hypothetical protein
MKKPRLNSFETVFHYTIALALIGVWPLFGGTQSRAFSPTDTEVVQHDAISYLLPIDTNNPRIFLKITPPEGTYSIGKYYKQFQKGISPIIEYVPVGETFENWSFIFTVDQGDKNEKQLCPNRSTQTIVNIISGISAVTRSSSLVGYKEIVTKEGTVSTGALQYQKHNGECELLCAEYYSKGNTVCGVQYTKKLPSWLNFDEARNEASKISEKIAKLLSLERESPAKTKD